MLCAFALKEGAMNETNLKILSRLYLNSTSWSIEKKRLKTREKENKEVVSVDVVIKLHKNVSFIFKTYQLDEL